jgi:hypothetical protein
MSNPAEHPAAGHTDASRFPALRQRIRLLIGARGRDPRRSGEDHGEAMTQSTATPEAAEERPMSRYTWTTGDSEKNVERWSVGWDPVLAMVVAQVEPQPGHTLTGLTGGWPEEDTLWEGPDTVTGQQRRVLVYEHRQGEAVAISFSPEVDPDDLYAHGADGEEVGIPWDQFGTRYTLIEPAHADAEPTGMTGNWPQTNTIWEGIYPGTGLPQRLQPQVNLGDFTSVVVTGPGEDDHDIIQWSEFGSRYTLVGVAGAATLEELQEQLAGRVQIPTHVRNQFAADHPNPPASRFRVASTAHISTPAAPATPVREDFILYDSEIDKSWIVAADTGDGIEPWIMAGPHPARDDLAGAQRWATDAIHEALGRPVVLDWHDDGNGFIADLDPAHGLAPSLIRTPDPELATVQELHAVTFAKTDPAQAINHAEHKPHKPAVTQHVSTRLATER